MSIAVSALIWKHFPKLPKAEGLLLTSLALADWADDQGGSIFPAVKTIAKKTRQSERTIQRHLRKLEDLGIIYVIEEARADFPTHYGINLNILCEFEPVYPISRRRGDNKTPPDSNDIKKVLPVTRSVNDPLVLFNIPNRSHLPKWFDEEAWELWVQHRKEIRKKLTPLAADLLLKNIFKISVETKLSMMEIVKYNIAQGYQGIFPPRVQIAPTPGHAGKPTSEIIQGLRQQASRLGIMVNLDWTADVIRQKINDYKNQQQEAMERAAEEEHYKRYPELRPQSERV